MADLTVNGVRLHVQRLGAGARVAVFVRGLVMDNLSSFYFTLATPAAARAVRLFDLRGHGLSERPAAGYVVADFVADLAALVDVESPDAPVDVIGNSFGGLIALAFAHAHPARVASLVLIDAHDGTTGWAAQFIFSFISYNQNKIWENSGTLWTHVLKYYKNTILPYGNRANFYRDKKMYPEALADYNATIAMKDQQPQA